MKNLIVTLADRNYVAQAKQLFSSVYWNAGWKGDYLLLSCSIPEKELKWFRDKGILIKKCSKLYNKNFSAWPSTLLSKFYLFTPYFKKWKNIIFLDADIIVRASFNKLTEVKGLTAFGNWKLSRHFLNSTHAKLEKVDKNLDKLKKQYNLNELSFNAGVLVFPTSLIEKDSFSKLKQLFHIYKEINAAAEGPILNLYFYKKWKKLPVVYNISPYHLNLKNIKPKNVKGIVLHFYKDKPWNPKNPFYREWKYNLDRAEQIDLKKPQPAKSWTDEEIKHYSQYLENKPYSSKYILLRIHNKINRNLGLIGIFLKNNLPKLYYLIKKWKFQ